MVVVVEGIISVYSRAWDPIAQKYNKKKLERISYTLRHKIKPKGKFYYIAIFRARDHFAYFIFRGKVLKIQQGMSFTMIYLWTLVTNNKTLLPEQTFYSARGVWNTKLWVCKNWSWTVSAFDGRAISNQTHCDWNTTSWNVHVSAIVSHFIFFSSSSMVIGQYIYRYI